MADSTRPGSGESGRFGFLLTTVTFVVVLLLYHRALGLGLVGDDIGFVRPPLNWLSTLLRPSGQWHFYPLNTAVFAILGQLTGAAPAPLHFLNLALHAAIGIALAAWLGRYGVNHWVRLFVAVFFVSRGIHYEVVAWITELSYLSVSIYTLLTLVCWDRYLRGAGRGFLAATAATFACAVFTIEHALLIAPICFLYDAVLGFLGDAPASDPARRPRWTRRTWRTLFADAIKYVPFVLVVVVFLGLKHMQHVGLVWSMNAPDAAAPPMASGMDVSLILPADRLWMGFLNTPLRAYRDLLSATSWLFLPASLSFGIDDGVLTRLPWIALVPWVGVQAAILWKGSPLARFLLMWIWVYELPLAAGSVPQARYYYMASMPASALLGLGLAAILRRAGAGTGRTATLAIVAVLLAAMVFGESRFIGARLVEWREASELVNATASVVQRGTSPETRELVLVNLPRSTPSAYWPAYAFANAAEHLPLYFQPPRRGLPSRVVYDRSFVDGSWPTIGTYLSREEIDRKAASADTAVFEFVAPPPRVVPLH